MVTLMIKAFNVACSIWAFIVVLVVLLLNGVKPWYLGEIGCVLAAIEGGACAAPSCGCGGGGCSR